ncbi:MAG: hypothetical protein H6584_08570 [Flavobacteriales bacterium]|nr:hypothetical protein [Flavobacteriales bacterium]
MNQEILNLIEIAVADGEITEKERSIILRKAELLGEDKDEVEMILDGKLHENNKTKSEFVVTPKSDKFGDIKKCPACGAMVQSYATICDVCEYEFSGIGANKTIEKLSEKLEEVRRQLQSKPYKNFLTQNIEKEQREKELNTLQSDIIKNFPVPNSREDILEMLHFISPKLKSGIFSDDISIAWRVKFYEIIEKAKFAYRNDKKMLLEISGYVQKHKTNKISKLITFNKEAKQYLLAGLIFLALMSFGLIMGISKSDSEKKEKERLEQIVSQINIAVEEENYDKALILAAQLKWEGDDGNERLTTKMWDEKRETLINQIENLKK